MIKLEDYSRSELKKIVKEKGASDYHNLSKADLIKLILSLEEKQKDSREEFIKKVTDEIQIGTGLSFKAMQWETYFTRINISPEVFLQKFPTHNERQYIEELIKFKSNGENKQE